MDSDSENKNDPLSGKVIVNFKIKRQDMVIDKTKLSKLPLPRHFRFQEIDKLVERSVENKDWFCVVGPHKIMGKVPPFISPQNLELQGTCYIREIAVSQYGGR